METLMNRSILAALAFSVLSGWALAEPAPVHPAVHDLAKHETPLLLGTLEQLVNIESGSQDFVGLEKIGSLIEARLRQLGMQTEVLPGVISGPRTARSVDRVGSMVVGRLKGTGTRKIALIAHMDTVYQQGMLSKQPYRVDGDRAYGLAITDDKGGIAMILHTVAILQQLDFRDYAELTVLINADEEIGSPGSKARIAQLGQESDVVLSFEGTLVALGDYVRLATSSLATATLKVVGRSAHAGSNPELGRNALYEMAHQILQSRDLSKPDKGLRLNWTLARAGKVSNAIPDEAVAIGDARAFRTEDFVELEASLRERIRNTLIPETQVELTFEYDRPPLVPTDASHKVAQQAVNIYAEIGQDLSVRERATGGGTDAAYAASLQTRGAVLESFGLRGYGSHSSNAEYVLISSIEPRLYLTARLIMEISAGGKK